jgi:hypothetical protein
VLDYRVARPADLAAAQALLDARYAAQGYGEHPIPRGAAYTTFVALSAGEVIATVTLQLRDGEAWLIRLASSARSTRPLHGLFDLAFRDGMARGGADHLSIEVHVHHVGFYRRAFGFQVIGQPYTYRDGQPVQRMRIAVDQLARLMRPALAA